MVHTSAEAPGAELAQGERTISFDAVSKTYADGTAALSDVSLACREGEITVFVGPSGCGKTTALRMINRMVVPSNGSITVGGADLHSFSTTELRRRIGYVIQNAGLFPHRRVIDNIATTARLLKVPRPAARERAAELMALVGLPTSLARKYPGQLSGGQQQRVGVARALAADPPILLMDEPFSALDPVIRRDLQTQLRSLQSQLRKTIVMVTHDLDEAVRLADQVVVFEPGTVAQAGAPDEVLMKPANAYVDEFTHGSVGSRWLSLLPSSRLQPSADGLQRFDSIVSSPHWALAVDEGGRPVGWVPPRSVPGSPIPVRRTFDPGSDSLDAALDSAVLSPAGQAVAVDSSGVVCGLVSMEAIVGTVAANRSELDG